MYEVTVRQGFAAAHFLRGYEGADEPLHGHNFEVVVVARAEALDPAGCAVDFCWIEERVRAIVRPFDHASLNDLPAFRERSPSAEAIARHIADALAPDLPRGVRLARVEVWETDRAGAAYVPEP